MKTKFNKLYLMAIMIAVFTGMNHISFAQGQPEAPDPAAYISAGGFVTNAGQLKGTDSLQHPEILYFGNAGNTILFLSQSAFHYAFAHTHPDTADYDTTLIYQVLDTLFRIDMKLLNSNANYVILPSDTSQGYNNYYYGNSAWTHALTYQKIKYENVYNEIDLAFHSNDEFRFNIGANGLPDRIKFYYQGATSVSIDANGYLNVNTPLGNKQYVAQAYEWRNNQWNEFTVNFQKTDSIISYSLGTHTSGVPLMLKTIHPPIIIGPGQNNNLKWSTYFGGNITGETFTDVYINDADYIYGVGSTQSANFPQNNGLPINLGILNGETDAFVVKFKPDRSRDFCTFYGGEKGDFATAVATDNVGNVIFTGWSLSNGIGNLPFPQCSGCIGYNNGGGYGPGFVVKLNSLGALDPPNGGMSTFYGFTGQAIPYSIATDNLNNIIIAGRYRSVNLSHHVPYPTGTNNGFIQQYNGPVNSDDIFIAKFIGSTNQLDWATQLGGNQSEELQRIRTDAAGKLYVYGSTNSNSTGVYLTPPVISNDSVDFPICFPEGWYSNACGVQSGFNPYVKGKTGASATSDAFICEFNTSNYLSWSTMFGGSQNDRLGEIAVSPANDNIFITGTTNSSDLPVQYLPGAYNDNSLDVGYDAFIAKFDTECKRQIWTTYYGGQDNDRGDGISVNNFRYAHAVLFTRSNNLLTVPPPAGGFYQQYLNQDPTLTDNSYDFFILKFNPSEALIYATYFGGKNDESQPSLAFQNNNQNLVIAGSTFSNEDTDLFPLQGYALSAVDYYDHDLIDNNPGLHPFITNLYNNCTLCREGEFHYAVYNNQTDVISFPNPASQAVFIKSIKDAINKIQITDMMGKMVYADEKISVALYACDVSRLPDGLYIIEVTVNGNVNRNKLVVSH